MAQSTGRQNQITGTTPGRPPACPSVGPYRTSPVQPQPYPPSPACPPACPNVGPSGGQYRPQPACPPPPCPQVGPMVPQNPVGPPIRPCPPQCPSYPPCPPQPPCPPCPPVNPPCPPRPPCPPYPPVNPPCPPRPPCPPYPPINPPCPPGPPCPPYPPINPPCPPGPPCPPYPPINPPCPPGPPCPPYPPINPPCPPCPPPPPCPHPGPTPPGPPKPFCPPKPMPPIIIVDRHTNVVKVVLENLLLVINYALEEMLKIRKEYYIKIIEIIEIIRMNGNIEDLKRALVIALEFISKVKKWTKLWQELWAYYRELLRLVREIEPIPDLTDIFFSPFISQIAYTEIIMDVVSLCIETTNLCHIDYIGWSQFVDWVEGQVLINEVLLQEICIYVFFEENISTGDELIRKFMKTRTIIQLFLSEWSKGGPDLNEPTPSEFYRKLPGFYELNISMEQDETVPCAKTEGKKKPCIMGVVSMFNLLEEGAYKEFEIKKEQYGTLDASGAAVE